MQIKRIWTVIKKLFNDIWTAIKKLFSDIWIAIKKLFRNIWIAIKKLRKKILTAIVKLIKRIWIAIVKLFGWRLILPEKGSRQEFERCVFVVAPHTSIADFLVGVAYLWSCCSNGKVFVKKEFFRWPLGSILRELGAISVDRGNIRNNMVGTAVSEFEKENFSIAMTPEATRKPVKYWKRGFWEIAHRANVAIVPTYIDFSKKEIGAFDTVMPSEDYEADLKKVRSLYRAGMAKHPEKFIEL